MIGPHQLSFPERCNVQSSAARVAVAVVVGIKLLIVRDSSTCTPHRYMPLASSPWTGEVLPFSEIHILKYAVPVATISSDIMEIRHQPFASLVMDGTPPVPPVPAATTLPVSSMNV
ncbi:hypothetical protein D3C76_1404020 [compost metagenome]